MYSSVTEGDLILWLIPYYLPLRITKSQTNLLLGFTWKLRHLLWYDTPLADSMLSTISPPWQATCSFCEPSENFTTCSFSTIVCHLHLLKTPPPGDSMPPAAAQMGKSLNMQQGELAVSIMVQQHHSVSRAAFQMQPLWSDNFKLGREQANTV